MEGTAGLLPHHPMFLELESDRKQLFSFVRRFEISQNFSSLDPGRKVGV